MHTITFTRDNVVDNGQNNTLIYNLPGSANLEGSEIALSSLYMYNSWENVNNTNLANNTFSFIWPELTEDNAGNPLASPVGPTLITVTIPNGQYEVRDINTFLQNFCVENNLYLVNTATGQFVYFLQIQVNPTRYAIQFNSFTLPADNASIAATYTEPAGGFGNFSGSGLGVTGGYPGTSPVAPGWYFPKNFASFVGFPDNTYYPSQLPGPPPYKVFTSTTVPTSLRPSGAFPSGSVSFLSTITPQIQPNPVIFLNCNIVTNLYTNPSTFLAPVPGKTGLGELLIQEPPEYAFNKCIPGQFSNITLSFTDSKGIPIKILDPNIIVTLILRDHTSSQMRLGTSGAGSVSKSSHTLKYSHHPAHNSDTSHASIGRKLHGGRY